MAATRSSDPAGRLFLLGLCLVVLVLLVTLACRPSGNRIVPLEIDYGTPMAPPAGTIPTAVP